MILFEFKSMPFTEYCKSAEDVSEYPIQLKKVAVEMVIG